MICEICGRHFNEGVKLKLEGSVVNACSSCASYGEVVQEIKAVKEKPKPVEPKKQVYQMQDLEEEEILAEDYGMRVKKAREKMNMKQGDLAKLINEPESVVHRIESGRFEPDEELTKKLEHKLGIRLTTKVEEAIRNAAKTESGRKTLGDVVVVRKKGEKD